MCNRATLNKITDKVVQVAHESLGSKLDKVILYGSYARGDFDNESDIDIMILANIPHADEVKEYKKINRFVSRLGLEHDMLITVNITACTMFYRFLDDMPFFKNIQQEGVVLCANGQ